MSTWHPDVDELADLVEGDLLTAQRTMEVRAHVAGCADCSELVEVIRGVPATLADLPVVALPPPVADGLDAALREESARREESTGTGPTPRVLSLSNHQPGNGTRTPAPPLRGASTSARARASAGWVQRHPRLRTAAAAAATIAVLGGAAALVPSQMSGSSSESAADAGAGSISAESGAAAPRQRDGLSADRLDATAEQLARGAGRGAGAAPVALGAVEGLRTGMRPS